MLPLSLAQRTFCKHAFKLHTRYHVLSSIFKGDRIITHKKVEYSGHSWNVYFLVFYHCFRNQNDRFVAFNMNVTMYIEFENSNKILGGCGSLVHIVDIKGGLKI